MRVPADDEVGVDSSHDLAHSLEWRLDGKDSGVVLRHRMDEQDPSDAVDSIDGHAGLEAGQEVTLLAIDLLCAPVGKRTRHRRRRLAVELLDQAAVGVATHE